LIILFTVFYSLYTKGGYRKGDANVM